MKYYILNGRMVEEIANAIEWAQWFENSDRIVKKTDLADGVMISTVFLGIDHSFDFGEPILFETMIFGGEHDQYQERYSTIEEAELGHQRAINLVFEV